MPFAVHQPKWPVLCTPTRDPQHNSAGDASSLCFTLQTCSNKTCGWGRVKRRRTWGDMPLASLTLGQSEGVGQGSPQDSMLPSDELKPGKDLHAGRYTLQEKITDGVFSTIWMSKDNVTGQQVVIKMMLAGDYPSYSTAMHEVEMTRAVRHPSEPTADSLSVASTSGREGPLVSQEGGGQEKRGTHGASEPPDQPPVVQLVDTFDHSTTSGRHACLVMELLGDNLSSVMYHYAGGMQIGLPQPAVKRLTRDMLKGLDHIHRNLGIIHMNLTPDNIVLTQPFCSIHEVSLGELILQRLKDLGDLLTFRAPSGPVLKPPAPGTVNEMTLDSAHCKLVDFGRACRVQEGAPTTTEGPVVFGHPGYRPPEEVLGLPYESPSYDMWQLACCVYALSTGQELFSPEDNDDLDLNDRHLVDMVSVLGRVPVKLVEQSPVRGRYFMRSGRLRAEQNYKVVKEPLDKILIAEQHMPEDEAYALTDFLTPLLEYDPARRPSASTMLCHPWLKEEEDGEKQEQGRGSME